ncbi:unnamed protein product [Rangifer tarandus platyrhynchus]|uniref:Uncharacterized protein n=1 Tax=Rangifer tarandus platyrhynchus TaxID=3082113 RepID=A0ABN8YPI2_RANTA|nr:unnamed protein product [Rangifer tarandus platyrhynchus]
MGRGWSRCGHGHNGASVLLGVWWQVAKTMKLPSLGHCVGCGGLHLLRPFPGSLIVWLSELSHSGLSHSAGGSFQGLCGLRVQLLSPSVLWDLAGGALGGLGVLEQLYLSPTSWPPCAQTFPSLCAVYSV